MPAASGGISKSEATVFHIRTDPKSVNNFFFSKLSNEKTHAIVTVRDRKIRTALGTNQIVGFVTVPTWKKKIY